MNKKAMGQIAAVNKLVACACAATSILLLERPVFADGCLQRNMPGSPDSEASSPCGCPTAGKDSAEVKDDCIKIVLGVGETTPWTGSRDVALKVFADDESPMVFTPYSLYAICGYTFKRIGNAVMADGSTPKEVVFSHPNGEPVKFVFAEGESLGRPDPGVHVPMDERLQMVDAEGWATAHDPVYWDLYMEDGRVRRYVATDMNGERGRFVSETDPHGRVVTPEDMGLDIVYDLNGVRQLLTPSRLADVQAFSNGYDVCVYAIQDVPARDAATGLYSVPSSAPYRVLTVRGENGGKRAVVTLKTGESEARTYIFDYVMGDWSLKRPNGVEERKERIVADGRTAFLSKTVVSPSGERLARSEMNYKWESWGFAMTNKVEGFGSATRTTSWTFWTSGGGKGKLKTRLEQSGLLTSYDYDGQGRKAAETRSGPDMMTEVTTYDYTPVDPSDPVLPVDTRPRTVVRKLSGIECERTYYVYSPLTNIVERVGAQGAAYGGTNVLRTVTTFYPVAANDARSGFVASIRHEDGKLDLYDYELSSNIWVRTVTHLHEQSPSPVSGKTTRDVTLTNARGETSETRTEAYIEGIWYTISRNRMTYNSEGKRTSLENLAGQVTTTAWDCCHKVSEVQPDGSTTTWDYDDDGRMIASSRLIPLDMTNVTWLTTCYRYDDLGRQIATWQTNLAAQVGLPVTRTRYDQLGRVIARMDQLGNTTTTTRSPDGRTVYVQNPNTSTSVSTRAANGDMLSITGNAVTPKFHTYGILPDGTRWSKTVQGETANSPRFTKRYENLLGQTIREERSGFQDAVLATVHSYDSLGRLVSTSADYEPVVEYTYDVLGTRVATTKTVGRGDLTAPPSPDTQWRKSESLSHIAIIDGALWLVQTNIVSCSDSSIAPLVASSSRQLTGLTPALPARSRSTDIRGNVTQNEVHVSVPVVTSSQIVPYATNRPLSLSRYGISLMDVSVSAVTNTVAYDFLGRQIANTDGRGNTRHTEYNSLGQRSASIDALGNRTAYAYDRFGSLASVTDPLGHATVYEYDLHGRKIYEGGATYPVRYTYDIFGNLASLSTTRDSNYATTPLANSPTASWNTTRWLYDESSGLITNKIYADGLGPSYAYTPDGKLATRTWARGVVTAYSYDENGSLTNVVYSDGTPSIAYAYDARVNILFATVGGVVTNTYAYDVFGNLTDEVQNGYVISRDYDAFGRPIGYALGSGGAGGLLAEPDATVAYSYDTFGRFSSVTFGTNVFEYSRLSGSDLVSGYTCGPFSRFVTYEPQRDLVAAVTNTFGDILISAFDYANDAAGRRVSRLDTFDGIGTTNLFGYNLRSEVTSAAMGTNTYGYAYDPIGNRLTSSHNAETNAYTANVLNQYTSIDDSEPTYDADGNMTSDGRGWHYAWNGENRMIMASNDAVVVTYAYDHRGRMVRKDISRRGAEPQSIHYTWDNWNIIRETISDLSTFQPFNISTSSYVWGLDIDGTVQGAGGVGGLLAVIRDYGAFLPAYDANGNISEYVSTNGEIVAHYDYSPFGETLVASGPLVSTFTHRFSTKYHDNNSGLGYWGYRWYESQLGRWMSRDPLQEQGGVSLFAFANNSAILYYDSLGESIGGIWDFLKKYANPYEIYQQLKNVYGKFRNVACPKIKALQNTDIVNCGCGLIGVADVASSSPLVERVDCLCNVLSSFGQMCDTGISSWQFWAYSALTTLDCASAPVAMVLGGLVGEAVNPAGGGVIGAIIGATPAGDAVIDVAAMALQNMVSQGTPLPMSQGKSCCNLIMTAVSELWGFEDSAGCECQKYSNP